MRIGFRAFASFFVCVGLGAASAAQAASVTYTCSLASKQHKAWIPQVLFIGHDSAQDRVIVSDPMVLHFNDAPIEGRVARDTARRTVFAWHYTARDSKGQNATMRFHATWSKDTKQMKLTAAPDGFSKQFHGSGTCETGTL